MNITTIAILNDDDLEQLGRLPDPTAVTGLSLSGEREWEDMEDLDWLASFTSLTMLDTGDNSFIKNVDGLANLTALTSIDLRGCSSLKNVDGLANLTALTSLDFTGCSSLKNIDALANLTELTCLTLEDCSSLTGIDAIAGLSELTRLDLAGCTALTNLDALLGLTSLRDLNLGSGSWSPVLDESGDPKTTSSSLANVDGLANLASLTGLELEGCEALHDCAVFENLTSLASLNLTGCSSMTNVDGLTGLTSLASLNLTGCSSLTDVDALSKVTSLTNLNLWGCNSVTSVDVLANLPVLESLDLGWCSSLASVVALAGLTSRASVHLNVPHQIKEMEEHHEPTCLPAIRIHYSGLVEQVDAFAPLSSVTNLSLWGVGADVDALANLTSPRTLDLGHSWHLKSLDGLADLTSLTSLKVMACSSSLTSVDALANLTSLTDLNLSGCRSLENIDGLKNLPSLMSLNLSSDSLTDVDALENLTSLTSLTLSYCSSLTDVGALENLTSLTSLTLTNCSSLTDVDPLASLTALTNLDLGKSPSVGLKNQGPSNIDGLTDLTSLKSLNLMYWGDLQNVEALANCKSLESLNLLGCKALQNVDVLGNLISLKTLDLSHWWSRSRGLPLNGIDFLSGLLSLESLDLRSSIRVDDHMVADVLAGLTTLKSLEMDWGRGTRTSLSLEDLIKSQTYVDVDATGLETLNGHPAIRCGLVAVTILNGEKLTNIDALAALESLTTIDLSGCMSLVDVDSLANLRSLTDLNLSGCTSLESIEAVQRGHKGEWEDGQWTQWWGYKSDQELTIRVSDCTSLRRPVTCGDCGGDAFVGKYSGFISVVDWGTIAVREPVRGRTGQGEKASKSAWSKLKNRLNEGDVDELGWEEEDGGVSIESEDWGIACAACGVELKVGWGLFQFTGDANGPGPYPTHIPVPAEVTSPWRLPSMRVPATCGVGGHQTETSDGGEACPFCLTGTTEMLGERVHFQIWGGRDWGNIEFKGANWEDATWVWQSRLESTNEKGYSTSDSMDHLADLRFRAGVGCSTPGCWEARGIQQYMDAPAAILAAAALSAALCSLNDEEVPDLVPVVRGLEVDDARVGKLVSRALKWVASAAFEDENASSDHTFPAWMGRARGVATQLLESVPQGPQVPSRMP